MDLQGHRRNMARRGTSAGLPPRSPSFGRQPDRGSEQARVVLVVEDEVMVRLPVAEHLRTSGYTVYEAGSAEEAVRLLQAIDDVDVVFSDVGLPGALDGVGLARWLMVHRPQTKVILTSGHLDSAIAPLPFLAKPYDLQSVETQIEQLLQR
jgi:DNA-binding NtrC family response regulator